MNCVQNGFLKDSPAARIADARKIPLFYILSQNRSMTACDSKGWIHSVDRHCTFVETQNDANTPARITASKDAVIRAGEIMVMSLIYQCVVSIDTKYIADILIAITSIPG